MIENMRTVRIIPTRIGKIVWLSVALGVLYWVIDAALDSFVFGHRGFLQEIFMPDPMCLSLRLINWAVISGLAFYAQYLLLKRKSAEEQVKQERDKAQTYLDVAAVVMLVVETDKTVSLMNKAGCALLGLEEAEVLGKNWFQSFVPAENRETREKDFERWMRNPGLQAEHAEGPVLTRFRGERMIAWHNSVLKDAGGRATALLSSGVDVTDLKKSELEREKLIRELKDALSEVKILGGLLPICASCKKIRDDAGYWHQVEEYIGRQTGAKFTHGICPDCRDRFYSELRPWAQPGE